MSPQPLTIIVSDLHMGGGAADPGDDFVYDKLQFTKFVQEVGSSGAGARGEMELLINGDFLEFAQVNPGAYRLGSSKYWCSEKESVSKLGVILNGHPAVFQALRDFQKPGNCVTIFAGNHDVDLYWAEVQQAVRSAAGPVAFELGKIWYSRYGGRLQISHGHMLDPANCFQNWANPFLLDYDGVLRLEMCPGTLFMVKFVNWLEKKYPFADNLHPAGLLEDILSREDRFGLVTAAWVLSRFAARHPAAALRRRSAPQIGRRLQQMLARDTHFLQRMTDLYRQVRGEPEATSEVVRRELATAQSILDFMLDLLAKLSPDEWLPVFDLAKPTTLSARKASSRTLSVARSGRMNAREVFREEARRRWGQGAQIVVLGHTHLPDQLLDGNTCYFNPGSWTRYVEPVTAHSLTLQDLTDETRFPYQLNYVSVSEDEHSVLRGEMKCYEEKKGWP